MEIKIRKSTIVCVTIIIVLIAIIGVLAYKLQSVEKNNEEETQRLQNQINTLDSKIQSDLVQTNETENEKQELNSSEIQEIEEFLNKEENNGFIQGEYNNVGNISDIQWTWILICASQKIGDTSNKAMQDYRSLMNEETFDTPVYKYKNEDIINFIKEKAEKQYTLDELQNVLPEDIIWDGNGEYCFLSTGEVGYNQAMNIKGYKQADKYIVSGNYYNPQYNPKTGEFDITTFIVTLQKTNNGYIFISNSMK